MPIVSPLFFQMLSSVPAPTSLTRRDLLATSVAGAVAFPVVLGLGQVAVFKPLCLTHSSPIASLCGCAAVLTAGCVASATAVQVLSLSHNWKNITPSAEKPDSESRRVSETVDFDTRDLVMSAVSSAILFRAFSGRFSSVLPSHLLKPGAFAREWIPVRSTQSTERQRHIVRELGKTHGCHSCGTRGVKQFHADHQPPTKIHSSSGGGGGEVLSDGSSSLSQRLYPQCGRCSSLQGTVLAHSSRNKWSSIRTHTLSLRAYHLFLPVPLAVAYLKSSGSTLQSNTSSHSLAPLAVEKEGRQRRQREEREVRPASAPPQSESPVTLHSLFNESTLIRDFPLLIIWNRVVYFLDSFRNAADAFHITLLAFSVIAALGTI